MKRHYLHLSVCRCDKCHGPVVTGSLAVRQNEISKETEKQEIGAICLSCGYRQNTAIEGNASPSLDADGMAAGRYYQDGQSHHRFRRSTQSRRSALKR